MRPEIVDNSENTASESESLRSLLNSALQQPPHIGARIVSLWWLQRLHRARDRWRESVSADVAHAEGDAADALHDARVETRRLIGALKNYRALLSGSARKRDLRNLQALNRVMSEARDADVATAWLTAEAGMLPDDARKEALQLRDALVKGSRNNARRVGRAFRKHFDAQAAALKDSLLTYRVEGIVGVEPPEAYFSNALSATLDGVTRKLYKALTKISTVADVDELHRVRRTLKQIRDLLQPFASHVPEINALYETATRGQDTLGAMRDAQQLAERARSEENWALASELDNVSLAHYNTFVTEWKHDGDIAAVSQIEATQNALLRSAEPASDQPRNAEGAPLEIERKYLLRGCPPEAAVVPGIRIEQGWLPGKTLRERLRRSTYPTGVSRHTRTVKIGGGISRIELEEDTERILFDALWPLTAARRVNKRRHAIREGRYTWEIDVFTDRDLVLAEVELKSESERPELPKWLAHWVIREVTGEANFFNTSLARPETHQPPPVAELQSL